MAAPTPPLQGSIETSDIEGRLKSFLGTEEGLEDQSSEEEAAEEEEPVAAAEEEVSDEATDTEPVSVAEEAEDAAPETEPESDKGIHTLSDLAREFDMPENDFLNHLEVDGPNGTVTLGAALSTFRNAPESAHRWSELQEAQQRMVAIDSQMQAQNSDTARSLAAHTQVAIDIIEDGFKDIQWDELEQEDPARYLILKQRKEELGQKVLGAIDSLRAMESQRNANTVALTQGDRHREMTYLHSKMPDWRDPDTASQAMTEVQNFLYESGFGQEEIDQLSDHRYLLVAYQASKFHQLQKQAPKKIEKLKRLPSTRGALKSGSRRLDDRTAAQKQHQRNMKNLEKTGDAQDAGKLMEAFL